MSDRAGPEHAVSDRALPPVSREGGDVRLRSMAALLALIGTLLLLLIGLTTLLFSGEVSDARFTHPFPDFPGPRLQPSPPVDMSVFYAQEMRHLNSAGWADQAHTRVHIPIDQAMRAVAHEGIPGWPATAAASEGARR